MTRDEVKVWLKEHSLFRTKRSQIPEGMKGFAEAAFAAYWDDDGNEHRLPIDAIAHAFAVTFPPLPKTKKGNCPRCGGTGHISAFAHIHGGLCMKCEGTGA